MLTKFWSAQGAFHCFSIELLSFRDPKITYESLLNTDCSITQEAYYNIKTGEIELIKVYGNTEWHFSEYLGDNLEINMEIYIHDIDEAEYTKKITDLMDYVKLNSDR